MKRRIRVELGHAWLPAEEAGRLAPGSEITLGVPAGCDAEIVADGRRIARGELTEADGCYCVRADEVMRCGSAGTNCGLSTCGPEADNSDRGQ